MQICGNIALMLPCNRRRYLYSLLEDCEMKKRFVIAIALLTGSLFSHQSAGIEELSLLTERATRSYNDMLDVRLIRALVVRSKTGYFFDGGQQRGITYD
jgi:hypothetical protein